MVPRTTYTSPVFARYVLLLSSNLLHLGLCNVAYPTNATALTSDGPERCRPSGRRCWQIRQHHVYTRTLHDVLYWLPVPQRIQFKIAISAFDCVREHCHAYFSNVFISRRHFWSGKSKFGRTPRHACPFDKNTAQPTEFPCCSPNRLERAFITVPLIIH